MDTNSIGTFRICVFQKPSTLFDTVESEAMMIMTMTCLFPFVMFSHLAVVVLDTIRMSDIM
jgi:hypothetical protein